ncbi:MAG: hypothetical protein OEQ28_14325 [Acidobacteriota bacterium]|nr:hypothetical protein [Acidobacteriota bacterium]
MAAALTGTPSRRAGNVPAAGIVGNGLRVCSVNVCLGTRIGTRITESVAEGR